LRARAAKGADPAERLVDGRDRERRLGGRRGRLLQRGPAHADLALAQLAGEEGDDGRGLGGVRPAQRAGDRLHLGRSRPRRGDSGGNRHEVCEQHLRTMMERSGGTWRPTVESRHRP
jgi:hypothetical protein